MLGNELAATGIPHLLVKLANVTILRLTWKRAPRIL